MAWAGLLCAAGVTGPAAAQQVFFGPIPNTQTPQGFVTDLDYPQLFALPSQWPGGMARVSAMLYRTNYMQRTPADVLRQQFAFLRSQHIAVAMVMGLVEASGCGHGIEGMVFGPNVNPGVALAMKGLGADVRYVIADEPLTFGHYSTDPGACQYSIPTLAGQFAREVAGIRATFPTIRVIDNEAAVRLQAFADVAQWVDLLQAAVGPEAHLTMGLDVQWQLPWQDWAQQIVPLLQQHGTSYGLLVHGIGVQQSDAAWLAEAEDAAQEWEALVPARPRYVFIQSWDANPTHSLPETDPTSFSSLILTYCANTHWRLACHRLH